MEKRNWEELPMDCLVDVLGRVGLESLLIDVPLVCKSWYKATLSPYCWQELDFPHPFTSRFELQEDIYTTKFVKGVMDRRAGCATTVKFPSSYSKEALTYVADKCPTLKILEIHSSYFNFDTMYPRPFVTGKLNNLVVHSSYSDTMYALPFVIGKLKNLEVLAIQSGMLFYDIVTQIGAHCENFISFSLVSTSRFFEFIPLNGLMTIVNSLPKIKSLVLRNVFIEREILIKILKGCGDLEYLDVSDCCGFDEVDEEILKLASHIPIFKCLDSVASYPLSYYCNDICEYYVDSLGLLL